MPDSLLSARSTELCAERQHLHIGRYGGDHVPRDLVPLRDSSCVNRSLVSLPHSSIPRSLLLGFARGNHGNGSIDTILSNSFSLALHHARPFPVSTSLLKPQVNRSLYKSISRWRSLPRAPLPVTMCLGMPLPRSSRNSASTSDLRIRLAHCVCSASINVQIHPWRWFSQ